MLRNIALLALIFGIAAAQMYYIEQKEAHVEVDSGMITAGHAYKEVVHVPGASWMRIKFKEAIVAPGAYIHVMALDDDSQMDMDQVTLGHWDYHTAYFNGDEVLVELIVPKDTKGESHFVIDTVIFGPSNRRANNTIRSICGPTDKRVQSSDRKDARILNPNGGVCSTWIFNAGPTNNRCFGTAGHCTTSSGVYTAQFQVPDSSSSGSINHPAADDQYPSDPASLQSQNGGVGADWAYLGFNPNNAGTASQRQGVLYTMSETYTGSTTTIRGYGSSSIGRLNLVQKIHSTTGTLTQSGSTLRYKTDTTGGNSGSAVSDGTTVYGVHTHGGCTSSNTGSNAGTSTTNAAWRNARNAPRGICAGK